MDFEQLKYFLCVAETANITKAAEVLYISQPTLSKYISGLEADLGVQLFYRQKNRLSLTPAGKFLKTAGHQLLHNVEELRNSLVRIEMFEEDSLKILKGKFIPLGKEIMQLSEQIEDRFPNVRVEYMLAPTALIWSALANHAMDIGIIRVVKNDLLKHIPAEFRVMELYSDSFMITVSSKHRLFEKDFILDGDLEGERIIIAKDKEDRICGEESHEELLDKPDIIFSNNREEMLFEVHSGHTVALMEELEVRAHPKLKRIPFASEKRIFNFSVVACWHKDNTNRAIDAFLDEIGRVFPNSIILR